jgi:hypothetical protein
MYIIISIKKTLCLNPSYVPPSIKLKQAPKMHPFNLLLEHVLNTIARDYQVPIKVSDYLIKGPSAPRGHGPLKSSKETVTRAKLAKESTLNSLDDTIKPFPNALPLSRMKRPDLITELEYYNLPTTGTVTELKLRLKANRVLPQKTKRKKVSRPKDRIPPLHDHPPTDEIVKTCAFCDSHGNSLSGLCPRGDRRSPSTIRMSAANPKLSGVEFHN